MLTPCQECHPPEEHQYWPQIREDGDANVWKCGRCGHVVAWNVGDYAEAYAQGDRLMRRQDIDAPPRCLLCGCFMARVCDRYTLEPLGWRCVRVIARGEGQWEHL